ncbi:MAG: hypothetical protein AAB423_03600 [Patescibacteria group bacterium]
MLQGSNNEPTQSQDSAIDSTAKTPAERQGKRNDHAGEPSTEGAIDHFAQNRFAKYDGPGGVDTGDDPSVGLGKELHERRDEAEEDRKKNARKNKVVATVSGVVAVGASIVAGVMHNNDGDVSTTPLRDGDKPALSVPNDASLAPTQPAQVRYNGVHTADAPMQSNLPTAPEDRAFGQELAERNKQSEQRAADALNEVTGGAPASDPAETGGAAPQTQ